MNWINKIKNGVILFDTEFLDYLGFKKSDLDIQDNLNLNRLKILLDQKLGTKSVIPKTYTEKQ